MPTTLRSRGDRKGIHYRIEDQRFRSVDVAKKPSRLPVCSRSAVAVAVGVVLVDVRRLDRYATSAPSPGRDHFLA